ncbi:MAG: hypothetical protein IPO24_18840 [Bacteroidetes bacterium]|nr:hypothetical protein [Bacteroidota bacterium]
MRKILVVTYLCLSYLLSDAQFLSFRGTNSSQFLSDNLYTPDLSHAVGGEVFFSKPIAFIKLPVNYNIGVNYQSLGTIHEAYFITGLTYVTLTPSGFMFAANAESVTMTTNNWLNYVDINMYNGVRIDDTTLVYKMGGELTYNVAYVLSKSLLLYGGFGGRYHYTPAFKNSEIEAGTSMDIMLKLGILWKFKRRYHKP